ncbi:hypothetical protein ACH5RR_022711 [Cinchona calisaya]|uniref:MULE transposase domain-containing protein n=1 Tax=Cinchona calisaya TaxID=153742 RepID=A0ABD2Z9P3_9GENT
MLHFFSSEIMGAVPEELMATLPNKLLGIDNQKVQDVHMWFGGYIEWELKVRYVGEKKTIFKCRKTNEITFDKLVAMHNKVDPGSKVNFYFRHLDCTLDITTAYLKCDEDVEIWATIWDHLPHLEGLFGGQLLNAIGRDGNDNMYPIAIVVVKAEIYYSWRWFLNELKTDIGIDDGVGWTFISDRQKGLVRALEEEVPGGENRQLHLLSFKFNKAMEKLEKADLKVGNTVNATGAVAGMVGRGSASTSSAFGADTGSSATPIGSAQQGIGKPPAGPAQSISKKVHSKK